MVTFECNHDYDYFGNVIEYNYDYLAFLINVIEYRYSKFVDDYTQLPLLSTITPSLNNIAVQLTHN